MKPLRKIAQSNKLNKDFFQRESHLVARELLGKYLVRSFGKDIKIGKIVETEVYQGFDDKASHASTHKITDRNQIMFSEGGYFYVYLIYGIYWNLNIITEGKDFPAAVLIRALEPIYDSTQSLNELTFRQKFIMSAGPGRLCRWLGIDKSFNGQPIDGEELFLIEPERIEKIETDTAKRVGVDYAGESADHEWRYYIKNNKFVSKL